MIAFRLPSVPIPFRVLRLLDAAIPPRVLKAAENANDALYELGRFRPLSSDDDRADFETELGRLALANKMLAAHHPSLIVAPWERAA